jgi:hypothetical protein
VSVQQQHRPQIRQQSPGLKNQPQPASQEAKSVNIKNVDYASNTEDHTPAMILV